MYLTKEIKKKIFKNYGKSDKDSGSAESQIALFSHRINHLSSHLKKNKKGKDTHSSPGYKICLQFSSPKSLRQLWQTGKSIRISLCALHKAHSATYIQSSNLSAV